MIKFLLIIVLATARVNGQSLEGNVAYLGKHTPFESLVKEMKKRYAKGKMNYQVLPFKRSLKGVIDDKTDFHVPILHATEKDPSKLGFRFSTVSIGKVIFGLYVNRNNKEINMQNFSSGKFLIEVDAAHVDFYPFKSTSSSCPKCSLQKVSSGRIDGYLYSALLADAILRENEKELNNIESLYFKTYDIKFAIPKGEKGNLADSALSRIIGEMKVDGTFEYIFKEINNFNKKWRPTRNN